MGVIVSTLFAHKNCPQRNMRFGLSNCAEWADSLAALNLRGVVFYSGISVAFISRTYPHIEFIHAPSVFNEWPEADNWNAVDLRWLVYQNWLKKTLEPAAFFTDISDVLVKQDPFPLIREDVLYCGDEPRTLSHDWMYMAASRAGDQSMRQFIDANRNLPLLNAGVIGGKIATLRLFVDRLFDVGLKECRYTVDMLYVNYVARNLPADLSLQHGQPVNSVFRGNQRDRTDVWFVHK